MKRLLAFMLVSAISLAAWGTSASGNRSAGAPVSGEREEVDDRAQRLIKDLGRFCKNYDFYYRHSFGSGSMRPVRCSRAGREATVVVAYAFSDRDTKQSWQIEWGSLAKQRKERVFRGSRWTVEVLLKKWTQEVGRELSD